MQDDWAVDQDGWKAFAAYCEIQRRRVFAQLEPLEDGTVHTGKRTAAGAWIDTTNDEIQRLRKDVADIDSALATARANRR